MSTQVSVDTDDDQRTVAVDHSPTRASSYAAIGAGLVAALLTAPFALLAAPVGFGGVGILAAGLLRDGNRTWVSLGAASLFFSVIIAGGFNAVGLELLLLAASATLLAWNLGQNAIGLGEQIGRHSQTRRNEIVHGTAATIVAVVAAAVGYAAFGALGGGRPVAALSLLLFGAIFLAWAIRT